MGAAGNLIKAKTNAGIAERAGQAQELYDRLSTRVGAVNGILDRAAAKLAKGDDPMSSNVKPTTQPERRWPKLSTDQKQAVLNQFKSIQDEEALAQQKPANGPRAVVTQAKPALPGL